LISPDGLILASTRGGALYLRRGHKLGGFDRFRLMPFSLGYKQGASPLPERSVLALAHDLRRIVVNGLEASGIELTQQADACTVDVRVYLGNLEVLDREPEPHGAVTSYLSTAGSALLVLEMRAPDGRALLRMGQHHTLRGGKLAMSGTLSEPAIEAGVASLLRTTRGHLPALTRGYREAKDEKPCDAGIAAASSRLARLPRHLR